MKSYKCIQQLNSGQYRRVIIKVVSDLKVLQGLENSFAVPQMHCRLIMMSLSARRNCGNLR